MSTLHSRLCRRSLLLLAFLLTAAASVGWAQQSVRVEGAEEDPPARVAHVTERHGGIVYSPEGEDEWQELPLNRPLTAGDRLWSDPGGRAELHLGTATLHLDGASHVGVGLLDDKAAQLILLQGSVNARVRELAAGENFEVNTPHLAFRAREPGDYRIDVDPQGGSTRVTVRSGTAVVFGEGGQSVDLGAGQSSGFGGRFLAPVQTAPAPHDAFAQWAAQRNQQEDRSVSARHVPRGVVGYAQLDAHGAWGQDVTYGTVWYPHVRVQDWAPYRHGRWTWIKPWGWTWVDDAPWGFAPFHYGRWATIGGRWAWVPGTLPPRPVYAPALVAFFGDAGAGVTVTVGGPDVGWYPLGPGEAWWPTYRTTPLYLGGVNRQIDLRRWHRNAWDHHMHRHHGHGITAVRSDDFRRGRPVREHWRPVDPSQLPRFQIGVVPQRLDRGETAGDLRRHQREHWQQRRENEHWQQRRENEQLQQRRENEQWQQRREMQRGEWQQRREMQREQWEQFRRQRHGGAGSEMPAQAQRQWGTAGSPPTQPQGQAPLNASAPAPALPGNAWPHQRSGDPHRLPQQAVPIGGRGFERAERDDRRGAEGRGDGRAQRGGEDEARRAARLQGGWQSRTAEGSGPQPAGRVPPQPGN